MNPLFPKNSRFGAALIITLSFLVLITALTLAFFVRTQAQRKVSFSSVSQSKANELALSSADILISELRQEMANGSQIYQSDGTSVSLAGLATATSPLIFYPSSPQSAVPAKRGDNPDSAWLSLVKRSVPTSSDATSPYALYSGTGIQARALIAKSPSADTANKSFNGRSVDDTIWRDSQLVPVGTGTLSARWCYVTRSGAESVADADLSKNTLKNNRSAHYAIGRFAYMVYNVGGLLDINAAGNALATGTFNATRRLINQVDLSQIPGISSTSFLNWRSGTTGTNTTLLLSGTNYLQNIQAGDQIFTSRQELIAYSNANPAIISGSALPLLTVFSRELNAPSCAPQNPAALTGTVTTGAYAYNTNQNVSTSYNRFIANVRMPQTTTLTSYLSNGTSFTYTIPAGAPLIQRRFPLNRLQWLGRNGPQNGGTTDNIRACFGLYWNNNQWQYVGPTGTALQTTIATLDTVAQAHREPNFFELLRAGILAGSLGLPVGKTCAVADLSFASADNQVAQIVANIIDQYNSDSFPKTVNFNGNAFYGSENIPRIYKAYSSAYRPQGAFLYYDRGLLKSWLEFEMWNPYQGTATAQPSQFRIRQTAGTLRFWIGPSPSSNLYTDPAVGSTGTNAVITVSASDLSSMTRDPKMLNTLRQAGASVSADNPNDIFITDGESASYTGMWTGDLFVGITAASSISNIFPEFSKDANGYYPQFVLEYDYGSGDWRQVQSLTFFNGNSSFQVQPNNKYLTGGARYNCFPINDPRTMRFGINLLGDNVNGVNGGTKPDCDATLFWDVSDKSKQFVLNVTGTSTANFNPAANLTWQTKLCAFRYADNSAPIATGSAPIYLDLDGVQRCGDSVWNGTSGAYPTLPYATGSQTRPVILHRPFRSVAELGYVFRDLPFKSLDFWTSNSADAALLDLFCVDDSGTDSAVVAGKVDLNTTHPEVLKALLSGVTRTTLDPANNQMSATEAGTAANALVALTGAGGPLVNKSELATRFAQNSGLADVSKIRKEAVVGALGDIGQTRTWNLLLDVVAQVGRFPATATTLDQFTVEGEKRYWVHVAIDRYTGEIVDQQIEPVIN